MGRDSLSSKSKCADRQGGQGFGSEARHPFEGLYARLPLVVPSAARRHRAVQLGQQARAKRRRVAKASRRAKPLPALPHEAMRERTARRTAAGNKAPQEKRIRHNAATAGAVRCSKPKNAAAPQKSNYSKYPTEYPYTRK